MYKLFNQNYYSHIHLLTLELCEQKRVVILGGSVNLPLQYNNDWLYNIKINTRTFYITVETFCECEIYTMFKYLSHWNASVFIYNFRLHKKISKIRVLANFILHLLDNSWRFEFYIAWTQKNLNFIEIIYLLQWLKCYFIYMVYRMREYHKAVVI